jgi:hypothetical protein
VVLYFIFAGNVIVVRHIAVNYAGCWDIWKSVVRRSSVTVKLKKAKKPTAIQKTAVANEKNPRLKKIWMIGLLHPYPDGLLYI